MATAWSRSGTAIPTWSMSVTEIIASPRRPAASARSTRARWRRGTRAGRAHGSPPPRRGRAGRRRASHRRPAAPRARRTTRARGTGGATGSSRRVRTDRSSDAMRGNPSSRRRPRPTGSRPRAAGRATTRRSRLGRAARSAASSSGPWAAEPIAGSGGSGDDGLRARRFARRSGRRSGLRRGATATLGPLRSLPATPPEV